ncbi:MAG: tryptophan--tRNA ligase [Oscillospiraceae bacterium]|nr:tryptophan--tRNA ligase [Oscillospiraceae bacterium]MDD4414091.1 tryptophan--tRNA ligase [Oscillospiraceae bacterium]
MENTTVAPHKKRALSCIQPTGVPTLGNYLGAMRNWVEMQDELDCAFAVADLHAITVRQEAAQFRNQIYEMFALLIAVGLKPDKSLLFVQSHVPAHAEMTWLLACHSQFGELSRMTQFKDKSAKHSDNINLGMFAYPSLMAADILLYQPNYVPVGDDQKQHVELTRDIAERFNNVHGKVFVLPEPYILKKGGRVKSLQDPTKKMSKSDENQNAFISLKDSPDTIMRKCKRAVTDSEADVRYAQGKDGINNLMEIYATITSKSFDEITAEFKGRGYGDFKVAVAEAVIETLRPVQQRFDDLMKDKAYLEQMMKQGAERAAAISNRTLDKALKKMGFVVL